jgi:hypothetical protein
MQIGDVVASPGHATYASENNIGGVVSGVVEDLNLQLIARIFDGTGSFDDSLNDVSFIEHGKLNSDGGELVEVTGRFGMLMVVPIIDKDQKVTVESVK